MAFTYCDIWIAMPGGGVALEGGKPGIADPLAQHILFAKDAIVL